MGHTHCTAHLHEDEKTRNNSGVYKALSQGSAEPTASAMASTSTQTATPKSAEQQRQSKVSGPLHM